MRYFILLIIIFFSCPIFGQAPIAGILNIEKLDYAEPGQQFLKKWVPYQLVDTILLSNILTVENNQHLLDRIGAYELKNHTVTIYPQRDSIIIHRPKETHQEIIYEKRLLPKWRPISQKPLEEKFSEKSPMIFNQRAIYAPNAQKGDTINIVVMVSAPTEKWIYRKVRESIHCYNGLPEHFTMYVLVEVPARYETLQMIVGSQYGLLGATPIKDSIITESILKKTIELPKVETIPLSSTEKIITEVVPLNTLSSFLEKEAVRTNIIGKYMKQKASWSEWMQYVVCCPRSSLEIKDIQKGLLKRGYIVEITNILDDSTKAALLQLQKNHNLPQGQLDLDTLRLLGVEF